MTVEQLLSDADIAREFDVVSGECISIANAIQAVCGGSLVAVSRQANARQIAHAAVDIDGTLYDGRGEVSPEQLCREFAGVTRFEPGFVDKYIWELAPGDSQRFRGPVYEDVKERLQTAQEGRQQ